MICTVESQLHLAWIHTALEIPVAIALAFAPNGKTFLGQPLETLSKIVAAQRHVYIQPIEPISATDAVILYIDSQSKVYFLLKILFELIFGRNDIIFGLFYIIVLIPNIPLYLFISHFIIVPFPGRTFGITPKHIPAFKERK
jgi:hypothetical protein